MSSVKEYNVILLGETGSGKSLFINSMVNYFEFDNLSQAISSEGPTCFISSTFTVTDSNDDEHELTCGENDGNERTVAGESFTIACKTYKLQLGDVTVRLMDTPGMGDTKGEQADRTNTDNILSFINTFDNLHAIAIVIKNTENKMTDRFCRCLTALLTNLNKSAVDNLVFILTHSRSNDFKPGPVKKILETYLKKELTCSSLILDKSRLYCFDNKCYEYLMATHQKVKFHEDDFVSHSMNWKQSSSEIHRLLIHIGQLTPHSVREMSSLYEARQFVKIINPFLPEVLQNIEANRILLNNYQNDFKDQEEELIRMERDENCKQIDIQIVGLEAAVTFCTSIGCREVIRVGGVVKYHYPQRCCVGCFIFDHWRVMCAAMSSAGTCKVCGCHGDQHERRFYETQKVRLNLFTEEAVNRIKMAASAKERVKLRMRAMEEREEELVREKEVIEGAEMKFTKFLRTHSMVKATEKTLSEKSDGQCDEYEMLMEKMEGVSVDDVYEMKNVLISLPVNGPKIKQILEANAKGLNSVGHPKEVIKNILRKLTFSM